MNLGELIVSLSLDYTDFDQTVERCKRKAVEAASFIEKQLSKTSVTIEVDDSALYDLNKHLDLKVRHAKEVNNYLKNNPITIRVDDEELTNLDKTLKSLTNKKHVIEIEQRITQTIDSRDLESQTTEAVSRGVKRGAQEGFASVGSEIEDIVSKAVKDGVRAGSHSFNAGGGSTSNSGQVGVEDLLKEIKDGFGDIRKQFGEQLIADAAKIVLKPGEDLLTGFSQGISDELGKEVAKGLQQSFGKSLNLDFKKLGEEAGNKLLQSMGIKVKKDNKVLDAVGGAVGAATGAVGGAISKSTERMIAQKLDETINKALNNIFQMVAANLNNATTQETATPLQIAPAIERETKRRYARQSRKTPTQPEAVPLQLPQTLKLQQPEPILLEQEFQYTEPFKKALEQNQQFSYDIKSASKVKDIPKDFSGNDPLKLVELQGKILKIKTSHQALHETLRKLIKEAKTSGDFEEAEKIYLDYQQNGKQAIQEMNRLLQQYKQYGATQEQFNELSKAKAPITSAMGKSSRISQDYQAAKRGAGQFDKAQAGAAQAGLDVIAGFKQGLDNKAFARYGAENAIAYLKSIKKAFGIQSPSKVMMGVGTDIAEGLIIGVQARMPRIKEAISDIRFQFDKGLANLYLNLPQGIRNQADHLDFNYKVRKPEIKSTVSNAQDVLSNVLNAVTKSIGDTRSQGNATLGQFIQNALKAGGSSLLSSAGLKSFDLKNIPGLASSLLSGNINGDFVAKAIPLLIPILGLKGLNLGNSIVDILNKNLAVKPGFLNDLFKSVTGVNLEKTGFLNTAFSLFGVQSKGKGLTPSTEVINNKIQENLSGLDTGGTTEGLIEGIGSSFVDAIFKKLGMSGIKADLIKQAIAVRLKSASATLANSLQGVAGGQISSILGDYAKGDVGGLTNKASGLLSSLGLNLDPKKVSVMVGLALTAITSFHKAFTEEGFNLGASLVKGFKDAQKNWQNAGDDLKRAAKKSVGVDSLGDITGDIVKRMKRGMVVPREMFDEFFDQIGKTFKQRALKGVPNSEKDGLMGNIFGFGASIATMIAPIATMLTTLTPLLIPLLPVIGALGGLFAMVAPYLGKLSSTIQSVEPLQRRLNFLGGSDAGGEAEMKYAQNTASRLNVPVKEGIEAYSQLAIAARGTKLEGDGVRELFEGISSSLSALGITGQDASLVFMAYTQILAKGKLSMEELRQQLGEKFPPAMSLFAKALGVSIPELNSMISKGALLSEEVLPKVAKVLNQDYGKAVASTNTFSGALTRLGNVGFDIAIKLTKAFGGVFAMFTNLASGILSLFASALDQVLPLFSSLMIGVTAVVGVGLATILGASPIGKILMTAQNLVTSGLGKLLVNLAPFYLGIVADVADSWLGAQNDLMDNMAKGLTNLFVAFFTGIDLIKRNLTGEASFGDVVGKFSEGNPLQGLIDGFTGLFRIIPSGVVEMTALVLMFEQFQVLLKTFLKPTLESTWKAVKETTKAFGDMAKSALSLNGIRELFSNTSSIDFGEKLKGAFAGIRSAVLGLMPILAEAAIAIGVILFAKSDFSNPVQDRINKMASEINGAIQSINSSLDGLASKFDKAGNSARGMANSLPSKGLELNIGYALGFGGESFKSDDLTKARNSGDTSKVPWYLDAGDKRSNELFRVLNEEKVSKAASEAKRFGIDNYFTGNEVDLTLAQEQLLNQFKTIEQNTKGFSGYLSANNLTKNTAQNLLTGDVGKSVAEVRKLDKQLYELGQERSKLGKLNTSEAREQISKLDQQLLEIEKRRTQAAKPFVAIAEDVTSFQKSIEATLKQIDESDNPPDVKRKLKAALEPMKQMAEEANKIVQDNLPVKPLEDVYKRTITALKDFELAYEQFGRNLQIASATQQAAIYNSGGTAGNVDFLNRNLQISDSVSQRDSVAKALQVRERSLSNLLSIPGIERTEERKKEIDDLRKQINEDKVALAKANSDIARGRYELRQSLAQQTKQVADYYRSAVREAQFVNLEFEKATKQLDNSRLRTRLNEALLGAGENIYTQFIEGIIGIIEQTSEIQIQQIEARKQQLEYQNQVEDIQVQAAELARSLPGQIIPFDVQVVENFRLELGKVDDSVETINKSIEKTAELLKGNAVDAAGELEKAFLKADGTFNEITNNLKKGFEDIKDSIGGVGAATANWLTSLASGQGLIGTLVNGLQAAQQGNFGQQVQQGVQQFVSNPIQAASNFLSSSVKQQPLKIAESVGSRIEQVKTYEDLAPHHPSVVARGGHRNRPYGIIEGRKEELNATNRSLIKKDFILIDSSGRQAGVPVPSPVAGYAGKIGQGWGAVNIYADKQMTQLIAQVGHMSNLIVKQGEFVKYGQTLGLQSGMGKKGANTYGIHVDMSATPDVYRRYIRDLQSGVFKGQLEQTATTQNVPKADRPYTPVPKLPALPKLDPRIDARFLQRVNQIAQSVGANPEHLLKTMLYETGGTLSPSARNRRTSATGLIQFMPATARGLGTNINALAQMTPQEQLTFVEKYLKQNSRGQKLDSFRKVLSTVFAGNPNASLGVGDGDISLGGYLKKAEARYGNAARQLSQIAIQGGFIQPDQMQQLVAQGRNIKLDTAGKQLQINQINNQSSEQNRELALSKSRLELQRLINKANQESTKLNLDSEQELAKTLQDIQRGLNPNMSSADKFLQEQAQKAMELTARISNLKSELSSIEPVLGARDEINKVYQEYLKKFPDSPDLVAQAVGAEDKRFEATAKRAASLRQQIAALEKDRGNILKVAEEDFLTKESFRKRRDELDMQRKTIEQLQEQLNITKQLEQSDPLNPLVLKIPDLERNISLLTEVKNINQQILDLDQRYYETGGKNGDIGEANYTKQRNALELLLKTKKEGIELTNEEQNRIVKLDYATRQLEKTQFQQQFKLKELQLQNEQLSLKNRNGFIDSQVLTNELAIKITELTQAYQNLNLEIDKNNLLTSGEKAIAKIRAAKNFEAEKLNAETEADYKRREAELVTNPQVKLDGSSRRFDLLNQGRFDLQSASIERLRNSNANEFLVNGMVRRLETEKEMERHRRAKDQLLIDVNKFNLEFPDLALTTEEIDKMSASLDQLNQKNLGNITQSAQTFDLALRKVFQDNLINGLTTGITDLINGTKSFGDVLNDLANNILNGLLNVALNSLFKGAFGGGGLFGGIFGFNSGGVVPNYADGGVVGAVGDALARERMASGRQPVLAALTPGERVLTVRQNKRFEELQLEKVLNFSDGGVVGAGVSSPSIPKAGSFSAMAQNNVTVNVPVTQMQGSGGSESSINVPRLQQAVRATVVEELQRQKRFGGELNR